MTLRTGEDVLVAIGDTPLVRLARLPGAGAAEVWLKLECMNPGQSTHDRTALAAILEAERAGKTVVCEAALSAAALSLAMVAAARGLRYVAFVPRDAPFEIGATLRLYGALVRVAAPGAAPEEAEAFARVHPEAFVPRLHDAARHAAVHEQTTAREIREALGAPDALCAPVRGGALLTGLARAFPETRVLGAWWLGPAPALAAEVREVCEEDAWESRRRLAREEGILAGPAGGAALHVALAVARDLGPGRRVCALIPDTGERWFGVEEARG